MRIVAGRYKGKELAVPLGKTTRPTADRVRESIFNILNSLFLKEYKVWIDLSIFDTFAGTGALGIEAISRGASRLFVAETDKEAQSCLRKNLQMIQEDNIPVKIFSDIFQIPATQKPIDLVFMDPPYNKGFVKQGLNLLIEKGWIGKETICVIEVDRSEENILPPQISAMDTRIYGKAKILIARLAD